MTPHTSSPTAATPENERLDSFEFPQSSSSSPSKKVKRQTAFYPNMNSSNKPQKPFSRSAAKRESVMALGSIEHLQHYFTKTGLSAKNNSLAKTKGFIPAIGGLGARTSRPSLGSVQELHLPPSPEAPTFSRPLFPPDGKMYEMDPENLKPGVINDLDSVAASWGLADLADRSKLDEVIDVLALLKLTTQLIRTVRNYSLSLPDDTVTTGLERVEFRSRSLQPMPARQRVVSNPNPSNDPLARIRRSALEVLTVLRALEEQARLPLSDEAYDAMSDRVSSHYSHSPEPILAALADDEHQRVPAAAGTQPSQGQEQRRVSDIQYAIISVPGRSEAIPVWDDDDDIFSVSDAGAANEKRDIWDERLVLGGGWLYRQDICLTDLTVERDAVSSYLSVVDEVLFDGEDTTGRRGWERAADERSRAEEREGKKSHRLSLGKLRDGNSPALDRVVSAGLVEAMDRMMIVEGMESPVHSDTEYSVEDDELPGWAQRIAFNDAEDPLARLYALLSAFLPPTLLPLLPSTYAQASRLDLLTLLSSGQVLCVAYNAIVRRSRRPWGFINRDSIHDLATLELQVKSPDNAEAGNDAATDKRKTGWTFRRIDNLRLWTAALKLRYLIPVSTSPAPLAVGTVSQSLSKSTPRSSAVGLTNIAHDKSSDAQQESKLPSPMGSPASSSSPNRNSSPSIFFDAKTVARHDPGWDEMLEAVAIFWVNAVVAEVRKAR